MDYILIEIDGMGQAYQEVEMGQVVRYLDLNGVELFAEVPVDVASGVIDATPPKPAWGI